MQVIDMCHRNRFRYLITVLLAFFVLASCESWLPDAHRPDHTQGNVIKRDALEKIHVGMKKSEVTPIIGSPMITDPFHPERWDYIYRFLPGRGETVQSRVTLFFENDVLIRIDDSEYREPESLENKSGGEPGTVEAVPAPDID